MLLVQAGRLDTQVINHPGAVNVTTHQHYARNRFAADEMKKGLAFARVGSPLVLLARTHSRKLQALRNSE